MSNTQILNDYVRGADADGVDPLQDDGLNAAVSVTSFSTFTLGQAEAGRPDLISYRVYGTTEYWREVMAYNGVTDVRHLVNGTVLRIPDRAQLMSAISRNTYSFNDKSVSI